MKMNCALSGPQASIDCVCGRSRSFTSQDVSHHRRGNTPGHSDLHTGEATTRAEAQPRIETA